YHENCVRCTVCSILLQEKCFEKSGHVYCRLHYYVENSPYRCGSCRQGIGPTEMVYKMKVLNIFYHIFCHRCAQCGRKITQGEQVFIDEVSKNITCIAHTVCRLNSPTSIFAYSYDTYGYDHSDVSKFLKRRGPRTTIKQYQLDMLNKTFTSTPKPSKHARAKLALETGLSMRVIQVWFQNRRSKERRLKHLCNYLRQFEQRGLIAPPTEFDYNAFPFDTEKDEEDIDN
ncbi:unnamed protein product, partial [Thelazia callipaeda]|uniref:Homeobox domain-containing protein n=1 Tax=Thelazia callipaeda TaxID=103827 RepID=A0A0N5CPV1_THECL